MKVILRCFGAFLLTLALIVPMAAQEKEKKAAKAPKMTQLSGRVQMINKDTSTITLQKGNVTRQIVYGADTKFEMGSSRKSTPSSIDQVKEGNYMYCGGTFEGVKLMAKMCRFREQK